MNVLKIIGEAILTTRSDAIIAADKNGSIIFWNPGAERIFGHSKADALGRSLDLIIPAPLRNRHWIGYRRVMESGESRYGDGELLSVPGITKDGRRCSLEFTIIPLKAESGTLLGLAAVMRDVTAQFEEIRVLKRKLAELSKQLTKLN